MFLKSPRVGFFCICRANCKRKSRFLRAVWSTVSLLSSFAPAVAEETTRLSVEEPAIAAKKADDSAREMVAREAMCLMIESAAKASNLPLEFFARVIWEESRFQSDGWGR